MPHSEISTRTVVYDALKSGKEVFIPYIYSVNATHSQPRMSVMDMLSLNSMEELESMTLDKWGIPSFNVEDIPHKKNCFGGYGISATKPKEPGSMTDLDLIVMPGMAFDTDLRRLGHGKGYYDNFLRRYWDEVQSRSDTPEGKPFLGKKQTKSPEFHKRQFV
jgi:5-formyltetrahydrofolate cyclo-ligase